MPVGTDAVSLSADLATFAIADCAMAFATGLSGRIGAAPAVRTRAISRTCSIGSNARPG
ncbi:hypothetical protein [Rhizobium leguminosarum]|uniref:hypothetical protein n=1 Tax=Rhizobium leguminosarum TaxID=384 RepID=UPI0024B3ABA5|nr:hypothetical protein [Rhizobium leguminosarum]WHO82581.1 hypothetical protein QMO81_005450 [Rhizobium leguminosarum]